MIDSTISNFHSILGDTFNHLIDKPLIITFPLSLTEYNRGYCLKTKGQTHETSISEISAISSFSPRSYDLLLSLNESSVPLCLTIQKFKACKSMEILNLGIDLYMCHNKTHSHAYVIMVGTEAVSGHEILIEKKVKYRVSVDLKFA